MRAVDKARADKGRLTSKDLCVYLFQLVTALIVIAIAGRFAEICVGHAVTGKGRQHAGGVLEGDLLYRLKAEGSMLLRFCSKLPELG